MLKIDGAPLAKQIDVDAILETASKFAKNDEGCARQLSNLVQEWRDAHVKTTREKLAKEVTASFLADPEVLKIIRPAIAKADENIAAISSNLEEIKRHNKNVISNLASGFSDKALLGRPKTGKLKSPPVIPPYSQDTKNPLQYRAHLGFSINYYVEEALGHDEVHEERVLQALDRQQTTPLATLLEKHVEAVHAKYPDLEEDEKVQPMLLVSNSIYGCPSPALV